VSEALGVTCDIDRCRQSPGIRSERDVERARVVLVEDVSARVAADRERPRVSPDSFDSVMVIGVALVFVTDVCVRWFDHRHATKARAE
jgi:hypothetical protein